MSIGQSSTSGPPRRAANLRSPWHATRAQRSAAGTPWWPEGRRYNCRSLLVSGAVIVLAAAAVADDHAPACAPAGSTSRSAEGLAVYLDREGRPVLPGPDTPRVTVPSAGISLRAPTAPAAIEAAPGGGKMVRVAGRLVTMSVAHLAADGAMSVQCIQRQHGARPGPGPRRAAGSDEPESR